MSTPLLWFTFLFKLFVAWAAATPKWHGPDWSPDYVLELTAQNISVDCESRYSVVVNGTSPGPDLYLRENQTTWIRVYNNMSDQNATVHWHGLSQRTSPFSDGTPQLAQWPIPPSSFFDYELRPDIGDAGTYFYHSHVFFQAISAHGAIIVEECGPPPYQYDQDITVMLADYYNVSDNFVVSSLLSSPFAWPGETHALLVNGYSGDAGFDNATDASCTPYILDVNPGQTYRMRFIGGTAISLITLGIEAHDNLTIIEADGQYTAPFSTDHLQVASGQRFSILLETKSAEEIRALNQTSFWIQYENRGRPANVSGFALLRYNVPGSTVPSSLPATPPVKLSQQYNDWLEYSLEPYDVKQNPFPNASQVTRTVVISVEQISNGTYNGSFSGDLQWAQNGDVWQVTKTYTPYLVNIYEHGQAAIPNYDAALANGGWDPASLAFPAKIGEVIDLVWLNDNGLTGGWDIHPFHAHGGHYFDLGSGNGTYNATANEEKLVGYNPVLRDTTMLYNYATSGVPDTAAGWRAWRIPVQDAGVWLIHCHILQHMIMGMQTVWVMGDASDITGPWPEPYISGYLDYGGSAYGNATYDPLVNHWFPE